jgi:signal transduction histidine kinase
MRTMTTLDIRTHDIENQLAVILGFAELLLADTVAGDPRHEDLEHIRDAALTARHLLSDDSTAEAAGDVAIAP